jgi:hypothetical protein
LGGGRRLPDIVASLAATEAGTVAKPLITGLESGWAMLPRAVIGGSGAAPIIIDVVLLHPRRGVAMLEVPPHWTPDASARLRHRLAQAQFSAIFPGFLPVVHAPLQRDALDGLPQLLARAFAAQPPLELAGGNAWMTAAQRALQAEMPGPAPGRPLLRGALVGLAGLALAGALGAAVLGQRQAAAPPGDPAATLDRLATGVMVPTEASAVIPLVVAGPMGVPAVEDASGVDLAEAQPPDAPPPPGVPVTPPDVLSAPAAPPLPGAPPDPPTVATLPGLEPPMAAQPVETHEAAALSQPVPEPVVQPPAEPAVQPPTEAAMQPPAEPVVQRPAEAAVQPPTEPVMQLPTEAAVQPPTEPVMQLPTEAAVQPPAEPVAQPPAEAAMQPPAEPVAQPPAEAAMQPPTEPAVQPPTEAAVQAPVEAAVGTSAEPMAATSSPATPAPSVAPGPPPRRPPADPALLAGLLRRGDALLALGDVSGARRFYERAAEAGSAAAARAAGRTHDPAVLAGLGVRGIRPDPAAAAEWYRRADSLAAAQAASGQEASGQRP